MTRCRRRDGRAKSLARVDLFLIGSPSMKVYRSSHANYGFVRCTYLACRLDHLEVSPFDSAELVEAFDAAVRGDGNSPVAAVVRDEHPVFLEPLQERLAVRRKACDVEVLAEAKSLAHAREIHIGLTAGEVRGRINISPAQVLNREPHGVRRPLPRSSSSNRTIEGRMGRPAASVDVQPSGRNLFDFRSKIDACAATQPEAVFRAV